MPLVLDLEEAGLVTIIPSENPDDMRVEGADLFQAFLPVATPQMQTKLWNSIRDGFISSKDLRAIGIEARFDMETLTLQVNLPPDQRKPRDISLRTGVFGRSQAYPRADVSAALNIYGTRSLWHENPDADNSANGGRGDLDGFVAFGKGSVLEAGGSYNEFDTNTWRRGDLRLVHDHTPELLRFTAGDLRFPATGFRSYIPMGGVSLARELSIDPDLVSYPTSSTRVQLRNPSRVDVIVNGAIVRTLRLPAGQFDVREIPLLGRINEIELLITDVFGRTESVRFPFIAANELLRPGLHQFSYNIGLPSTPVAGRYDYDEDRLTVSASHHAGLSEHITLGAFAQGNRAQNIAGIEALTVNSLGLFRFEVAGSQLRASHQQSAAGRLAYRSFQEGIKPGLYGWGSQYEIRGRNFVQLGELFPSNRYRNRLETFVNFRLTARITTTLGGFHDWANSGQADSLGAYVNTSASLSDQWQLGLDLSATDDPALKRERRAFVTLRWRDPSRPMIAAVSTDTRDSTHRAELAFSGERVRADANIGLARSADYANANVSAFLPRAQIGYGLNATATPTTSGEVQNTVSLFQAGAAIAYADGHISLSRPISESFALVGSRSETWSHGTRVNPQDTAYASEINSFGPASVSDLQAYRPREIYVDTTPLQTGMTLDRDRFLLVPGYRSGYHLPLKLKSVVVIQGRLILPDGSVAALLTGEVRSAKDQAVLREFFTDREGWFEIDGLNPGDYVLVPYEEKWVPLPIQVAPDTRGTIGVGDWILRNANE